MGIELHYSERGSGEPLILLHGNGEDSSYFEHQVGHLAQAFRVIALDTRGHGLSPRGSAPFSLDQFATDLGNFMDARGIGSAHIFGFSDGANIALLFTLAHPERVKSLVLNGGNLFPEGLTPKTRRGIDLEYRVAMRHGDADTAALMRLMIDEPQIDPASLSALGMPVLVIAGTDDMILEEHTRLIAESIPGARLRFVEGDHFVAAGNPEAFNAELDAFYAGL